MNDRYNNKNEKRNEKKQLKAERKYQRDQSRYYRYQMRYESGHNRSSIRGFGQTLTTGLILLFIASRIFDFNIWLISDLSVVQFIFILIALHFILKGVYKLFWMENKHDYKNDDRWERWDTNTQNYNQSPPPPPPPPNQTFSDYNPYEQERENSQHQNTTYNEQDSAYEQRQSHTYYQQENEYDKRQSHTYHQQDSEFKQHQNQYNQYNREPLQYNTFIGDFRYEESYTQMRPIMFNAFIGDATIDLSRVEIPIGETLIQMSCFIGDMKVHMPNDPRIGVKVSLSSFIGDSKLFEQHRSGFGGNIALITPNYYECDRRISVELNSFIGDLKVKRVG